MLNAWEDCDIAAPDSGSPPPPPEDPGTDSEACLPAAFNHHLITLMDLISCKRKDVQKIV
jgi:hypothetical protein